MQVSIETISGLQRCMTVGVPAAQVEEKVTVELKKLAKGRRIDGFRPGKVPPSVIKRMFGQQARYEAIYQQMQESFFQAVQEQSVKLAGMPAFDPTVNEDGKDLEFKATFEVYPEIELNGFDTISVEQQSASITDEDVSKMVETLQKQNINWEESDDAAADGDRTTIDFEGFIDGEAFEGGSATGHVLVLGSNSMIPGFESGLVGTKAGEETTLDVTFPDDYQKDDLQGKPAQFKVTVSKVEKGALPEMNEEFYKSFGVETDNEENFVAEISTNMERELTRALRSLIKQKVLDGLLEANKIDVPSSLIDQEVDRLRQQAVQQFGGQMDASQIPAEIFKPQAEKRVQTGLLINAVIDSNELTASDEKIDELIEEIASTYQDPDQVREYYNANAEQKSQVESLALEEQVVEKVLAGANVTQVESSYEDIIRAANTQQPA